MTELNWKPRNGKVWDLLKFVEMSQTDSIFRSYKIYGKWKDIVTKKSRLYGITKHLQKPDPHPEKVKLAICMRVVVVYREVIEIWK